LSTEQFHSYSEIEMEQLQRKWRQRRVAQ